MLHLKAMATYMLHVSVWPRFFPRMSHILPLLLQITLSFVDMPCE